MTFNFQVLYDSLNTSIRTKCRRVQNYVYFVDDVTMFCNSLQITAVVLLILTFVMDNTQIEYI